MPRPILAESQIHPAVREKIANYRTEIVKEVQAAVAANGIVVVGMRMNPFPKKARKALDAAGIAYKYLEYGSYLGEWRRRLALKMWTGWPTFPMVFVKGVLVGGAVDAAACIAECRRVAHRIESPVPGAGRAKLPACCDPDDQKFLEAALAARAGFLITKDRALLELAARVAAFRILTPEGFAGALRKPRAAPLRR